jgi:hypothetical protein
VRPHRVIVNNNDSTMTPAVAATQETRVNCRQKRSPDGHDASAITMQNNEKQCRTMEHADMAVLSAGVDVPV